MSVALWRPLSVLLRSSGLLVAEKGQSSLSSLWRMANVRRQVFKSLYGGQFTLSTQLTPNFVISSTRALFYCFPVLCFWFCRRVSKKKFDPLAEFSRLAGKLKDKVMNPNKGIGSGRINKYENVIKSPKTLIQLTWITSSNVLYALWAERAFQNLKLCPLFYVLSKQFISFLYHLRSSNVVMNTLKPFKFVEQFLTTFHQQRTKRIRLIFQTYLR